MTFEEWSTKKMDNIGGLLDLLNRKELIHAFNQAYQAGYKQGITEMLTAVEQYAGYVSNHFSEYVNKV